MEYVTLVNRSSKDLIGTWDGKRYPIKANSKHEFPRAVAEAIKRQNPIMGSDDPLTGNLQYLCAIPEEGDDITPIEQSDEIELYNRNKYKDAVPVVMIPARPGLYGGQVSRSEVASSLPLSSSFVKP